MFGRLDVRLALACVAAPVLGVTACALAMNIATNCFTFGCTPDRLGLIALIGAGFGVLPGIPVMLIIGLALHARLRREGKSALPAYLAPGAIAGALAALIFIVLRGRWALLSSSDLMLIALGAAAGCCSAAVFWGIARPDRPHANPVTSAP